MATDDLLEEKPPARVMVRQILRKVFLEDWGMKLVALAITLALWVGVTGLSTPTVTRLSGVPLTLRFPNNTEVTNASLDEIDLVISGDKRKIDQINKNDLIVSLDLTDIPPGDRVIQLTPQNVSVALPTGIKLDEIQPNRIAVRLEAVEEKEVPVVPATEGRLPEGFEVYGTVVSPPRIRVRGPASFIRSLSAVSTAPIDLNDRRGDFVAQQVSVNVADSNATPLESVVDVAYRIGERRTERLFLVPIDGDTRRRATVILFGPRSIFSDVTPADLSVQVSRDGGEEKPELTLPPRLEGQVEVRRVRLSP
jgi:hypothetical protein